MTDENCILTKFIPYRLKLYKKIYSCRYKLVNIPLCFGQRFFPSLSCYYPVDEENT